MTGALTRGWLGKMSFADVIKLSSHYTVARMLERDEVNARLAELPAHDAAKWKGSTKDDFLAKSLAVGMTRPTPLPLRVGAKQNTCSGPL